MKKQILAIGGGGFQMEKNLSPIDDYILTLSEKDNPRICFIPTACGDSQVDIDLFYSAFKSRQCDPSHLPLIGISNSTSTLLHKIEDNLLSQDIICIGCGDTKSALSIWRNLGFDIMLKKAFEAGILLSGMSAGAMCWFEHGLTDTFWKPGHRPLNCLGLLPGGCGVHYSSDPIRRATAHKAIEMGSIPSSILIDDFAAVLFTSGSDKTKIVSWKNDSTAYCLSFEGERVNEKALSCKYIGNER